MIKIAPSILAADPLDMGRDVQRVLDAGCCDLLHVDIMDAHFVPNLSFSPATVQALHRRFPDLPLDVHLMMDNPGEYLEAFAQGGAWGITIHAEVPGAAELLRRIRALGLNAGVSVKPKTTIDQVADLLPLADLLLVMTVEPGFGGQKFQPEMVEKLRQARVMGFTGLLETDGGVSLSNLPQQAACGLDIAVMGTKIFCAQDPAGDAAKIHAL